mmetsp:Transcript_19896/g.67798  ORF Transcript_19896/g.67798 Transcript_19896/m.67798 type:complete len:978 (-) Transcript_19896:1184-4117(-)
MKFGKRIAREQYKPWAASYVDYATLKQDVKKGKCINFAERLKAEASKVSVLYQARCAELAYAVDDLESRAAAQPNELPRTRRALVKRVCPGLARLRQFVVINYTAVVKAAKKWNRHVASHAPETLVDAAAVLHAEPFFSSGALAQLVTRAELLAHQLAPPHKRSADDFNCPVCLDVLRNPVVLSCAHRFCFECIATAATYASEGAAALAADEAAAPPPQVKCLCPVCRKPIVLDEGSLDVDPALDDYVRTAFPQELREGPEGMEGLEGAGRGHAHTVPKVLVVGAEAVRPEAMLLAPTPDAVDPLVVRGEGAYWFGTGGGAGAFSSEASQGGACLGPGSSHAMRRAWTTVLGGRAEGGASVFEILYSSRPWLRHAFVAPPRGVAVGASAQRVEAPDDASAAATAAELVEGGAADVLAVRLRGARRAAQGAGGVALHSADYLQAVSAVDAELGKLLAAVRRRGEAAPHETWLVVFTTVNPVAGEGSAGEPTVLLLSGASAGAGELSAPATSVDVLPTVLDHFQVRPRASWAVQGRSLLQERLQHPLGGVGWSSPRGSHATPALAAGGAQPHGISRAAEGASSAASPSGRGGDEAWHHPLKEAGADAGGNGSSAGAAAKGAATSASVPSARFLSNLPGMRGPVPTVVGHRGGGGNTGTSASSYAVRENTLASFRIAHANGAEWVELDVQVTRDGVPVVWHDDHVVMRSLVHGDGREDGRGLVRHEVRNLSLAEFRAAGPMWERRTAAPSPGASGLMRAFDGVPRPDVCFPELPWDCAHEDRLPTLEEVLKELPPDLGLNLELKFIDSAVPPPEEVERDIRAVSMCVEQHGRARRAFFSSFEPSAALAMRKVQEEAGMERPVFFLTNAGTGKHGPHADPRRNSVRAAISVASGAGLAGVVSEVDALMAEPALASEVRGAGLILATYGDSNASPRVLEMQAALGVSAIITDDVPALVAAQQAEAAEDSEPAVLRPPTPLRV